MTALGTLAAALLGVFALVLLKKYSQNTAAFVEVALVVLILFGVFKSIKEVLALLEPIMGLSEAGTGGAEILLKIFGLLSAGAFVSDICRDNSESAVGNACELFVRVLAAVAAMPVFVSVIKIALEFLSGG